MELAIKGLEVSIHSSDVTLVQAAISDKIGLEVSNSEDK